MHVINVTLVELWGKYRGALQNVLPSVFCSLEKITYSSSGKYECVFETDSVVKEVIEVKCKLANVIHPLHGIAPLVTSISKGGINVLSFKAISLG